MKNLEKMPKIHTSTFNDPVLELVVTLLFGENLQGILYHFTNEFNE